MVYGLAMFDFDGTLADTLPWLLEVFDGLADRHGLRRISPDEVETLRGCDARTLLARLEVPAWKLPLIGADLRRLMARDAASIALHDGAAETLEHLHDLGVVLAVVSSNSAGNVQRILGPRIAGMIAHYECGAALFGKAGRIARVLARSGVPASRAILIGDEIRDHEAAEKAGVAFGAVAWGYATPEALAARRPALMFRTMVEITRVFS